MRALRWSLITLVLVVGLLVAADRVALELAEDEAAGKIQRSQDLRERPEVSIKGFPFLTQALAKRFDEVEAKLSGVKTDAVGTSLRVDQVEMTLHDVELVNGFSAVTARRASGHALISYQDLTDAAPPGIRISYGGKEDGGGRDGSSKVKLTARVELPLIGPQEHSVYSTVSIVGKDTVRVRADEIPFADQFPELEKEARKRTDFDRRIKGLPEGMELKSVTATERGVVVVVEGRDVKLTG